ncbi:uncharacterized protein LOC142343862 [Convolutriloba macropyga]|uniref:uncharacterized protein LOC142343862 n=1 Tax=Convolutriloba macropyga TaxID=536237 RepID=UPI003F528142
MQVNSVENLGSHFWKDLYPYQRCCIESPLECASKFKPHRKTIIGNYVPRNLFINRGDPDITTADGKSYPFMGLGVFTMLQTHFDYPTIVQASMRRIGQGTVISGVAVKFNGSLLECHINISGLFQFAINGHVKEIGVTPQYIISGIQIKESDDLKSFQFRFLGNSFLIQIVIVNNFLNLLVSVPPTFKSNMSGLMGNFDGDPNNDYQAKNGTILDPDSDFMTVDQYFGRSWQVPQTERIFSVKTIIDRIENETQSGLPFEPTYDIIFPDEATKLHAEQKCKNDTACLRDMSLVGNDSIADAFLAIEGDIRDSEVVNQIYRNSEGLFFNEIVIVAVLNQVIGETTVVPPSTTVQGPATLVPKFTTSGPESTTSGPESTSPGAESTTSGPESTTSGPESTTSGQKSTTSGPESTTSGPESTTSGPESTTSGPESTNSGPKSTTSGPESTTSGPKSTTSGPKSTTSALKSTTSGPKSTTSGSESTTSGRESTTSAPESTKYDPKSSISVSKSTTSVSESTTAVQESRILGADSSTHSPESIITSPGSTKSTNEFKIASSVPRVSDAPSTTAITPWNSIDFKTTSLRAPSSVSMSITTSTREPWSSKSSSPETNPATEVLLTEVGNDNTEQQPADIQENSATFTHGKTPDSYSKMASMLLLIAMMHLFQ